MESEDRSLGERAKERIKGMKEGAGRVAQKVSKEVGGVADTFSGKKVEDLVSEYSELYTKVALGLHQDVDAQREAIERVENDVEEDRKRLSELSDRVSQVEALVQEHSDVMTQVVLGSRRDLDGDHAVAGQPRTIALAALVISLVALAGAIWNAL